MRKAWTHIIQHASPSESPTTLCGIKRYEAGHKVLAAYAQEHRDGHKIKICRRCLKLCDTPVIHL
jgi:hypothetical protein